MAKAMGPFRDLYAPSCLSGPRTDVPAEPPSHRPCISHDVRVVLTVARRRSQM